MVAATIEERTKFDDLKGSGVDCSDCLDLEF
jgi:hypothetical protein